jgi:hypothetical protein
MQLFRQTELQASTLVWTGKKIHDQKYVLGPSPFEASKNIHAHFQQAS